MHYKNGREAKVGDQIVGKDSNGNAIGGTLINANAQSTTCNGYVMPASETYKQSLVTLSDCLHIDDVFSPAETPDRG